MKRIIDYINEALIKNHAKGNYNDSSFKLNCVKTTQCRDGKVFQYESNILPATKKIKEYWNNKITKTQPRNLVGYNVSDGLECTHYRIKMNFGEGDSYYTLYILLYFGENENDLLETDYLREEEQIELLSSNKLNIIKKEIDKCNHEKNN